MPENSQHGSEEVTSDLEASDPSTPGGEAGTPGSVPGLITQQDEFDRLCDRLERATTIAFDTEFVSEDCYRPDLCLIQIATPTEQVVVDPKAVPRVDRFWSILTEGEHETIVHAGREELRFCLFATGALPKRLVDIQLAAGLVGMEYPAAYRTLVQRMLRKDLAKEETRTNWRARPLTDSQIAYALTDVEYLMPIRDRLFQRLERMGRVQWCWDEVSAWARSVQRAELVDPWRRVAGSAILPPKGLAVVRELWRWREETAQRRNCPARRVLRDDLIVELAKRGNHTVARIKNLRGLDRGDLRRHLEEISDRIRKVTDAPRAQWPAPRATRASGPPLNLLVQFMQTALACLCRDEHIAPTLVGTSQDLKDFVNFRLGLAKDIREEEVALLHGWRREMVAETLDRLLEGGISIGVEDPRADQPLKLVRRDVRSEPAPDAQD